MQVRELLQEATELSKLGFSRAFIRSVFDRNRISHSAKFTQIPKKELISSAVLGNLFVAKTKNGEVAIEGSSNTVWVDGKRFTGFVVVTVADGEVERRSMKAAAALAMIPKDSIIYKVPYDGGHYTRSGQHRELEKEQKSSQMYRFLDYMNETYGPALQREAESAMEFIFKGLRHLDKRTRDYNGAKTEAEKALGYAAFIEEVAENGFTREAAEEWHKVDRGFGSHYANIENFVEAMQQPAAAAKLAKVIFKRIREAKATVQEMLKAKMKEKLSKM